MKRIFLLLALAATLVLGLPGTALAADEELAHTGRVLIVANGDIEIGADERADAVIVLGGDARVEGTVDTLVVIDGTATVAGGRLETVSIVNGTANLAAGSTVTGDVLQFGSTVERAEGVAIGGSVKDMTADMVGFGVFMAFAALAIWVGFGIATLLAGLLVAGLAARQARAATTLISREPATTALVGLVSLVVPPVLAVLAMATIIGIPAGFGLLVVIWPAVAFIGYIVAAIWLGEWLLRGRRSASAERPYAAAVVGLLVAFVIGLVPLVTAVLSIFGLGAVVLASWRTLRGGGSIQPVIQAQPAPVV